MLRALVLAALLAFPSSRSLPETPEEYTERLGLIADSIASASLRATCEGGGEGCRPMWSGSSKDLAALLIVQAWMESKLLFRVHAGLCRDNAECDGHRIFRGGWEHRARGLWQIQKTRLVRPEEWDLVHGTSAGSTDTAAWVAARVLARGRGYCEGKGTSWLTGALSLAATGRTCTWSGTGPREALFARVRARLR